jgi:hypothetical protein
MDLCLRLGANGFLKKQVKVSEAQLDFEHIIAKIRPQWK